MVQGVKGIASPQNGFSYEGQNADLAPTGDLTIVFLSERTGDSGTGGSGLKEGIPFPKVKGLVGFVGTEKTGSTFLKKSGVPCPPERKPNNFFSVPPLKQRKTQ